MCTLHTRRSLPPSHWADLRCSPWRSAPTPYPTPRSAHHSPATVPVSALGSAAPVLVHLPTCIPAAPLDPEYPPERLGYMLEDARVPVLLTQERIRERLPESDARIVELDKEWEQIARESSEDLPSVTAGENAAYVMYTSGSTGRPKGVVMLHGVLANLIGWHNQVLRPRARTLQFASLSFD